MPEDVNGLLETDVFQRLAPGRDRICSVLVAEGFDYPTVSAVMGISDFEIRHLLAEARKRLLEAPSGHHMSPPRQNQLDALRRVPGQPGTQEGPAHHALDRLSAL